MKKPCPDAEGAQRRRNHAERKANELAKNGGSSHVRLVYSRPNEEPPPVVESAAVKQERKSFFSRDPSNAPPKRKGLFSRFSLSAAFASLFKKR